MLAIYMFILGKVPWKLLWLACKFSDVISFFYFLVIVKVGPKHGCWPFRASAAPWTLGLFRILKIVNILPFLALAVSQCILNGIMVELPHPTTSSKKQQAQNNKNMCTHTRTHTLTHTCTHTHAHTHTLTHTHAHTNKPIGRCGALIKSQ